MLVTEDEATLLGTGDSETDGEFRRLALRLGFESPFAGRYLFERTAGIGAMGAVHVAFDTQLERRVAVKQVRSNALSNSKKLSQRLAREAQALARINHPNVVTIHDVGEEHGQIFVAMEYVPGSTLAVWQSDARRTTWEIIDAYIQAGRGLAAAHGCAVVHRDFKPENVLVGEDGVVRVVDFGIAAGLESTAVMATLETDSNEETDVSDAQPGTPEHERLTATGALLGTLPYMSPEQLSAVTVDPRSDQFSFCVALWEALSGVRPFAGRTPGQLLHAMQEPPLGANELPRWLRKILARGLRMAPDARHRNMNALLAALEGRRRKLRFVRLTLISSLALTGAVAMGWWLADDPTLELESCASFQSELEARWDATRRASLRTRLAALDPSTASFVIDEIDRFAVQWTEAAGASCTGEVAPPIDSRTRECLTSYLDTFERSVDALTRVDRDALARAPDLLGRLSPPGGDYCAISPSAAIDPRVAHLARSARAAALLGELAHANELADAALRSAQSLDHDAGYTLELAEARLARAEARAYAGEFEPALVELEQAQAHAYGDHELSLAIALLRIKSIGLSEGELAVGRTVAELLDPLANKLALAEADPRRAEIEEARGLLARAEGACDRAVAHHERARTIFMLAKRPTDAGKALLNIGACRHDKPELAAQAYAEALELFRAAGVPPSYRNRVEVEFNLGVLALDRGDLNGLPHFEAVIRDGSPHSALEAMHWGVTLAYSHGDPLLADEWARRGLELLVVNPDAPVDVSVSIRLVAGMIVAERDLESGLELMSEAERDAAVLDLEQRYRTRRNRLEWSKRQDRCDEMQTKLAELAALETEPGAAELGIAQWRAEFSTTICKSVD
jgi:serine/threonine protein kinase/tetratricopeptide (TPR) repeat protein